MVLDLEHIRANECFFGSLMSESFHAAQSCAYILYMVPMKQDEASQVQN